ncbi:threonine-phosphate decarboxylase CobD [Notoacmeibacter sp. MSK16QG-6]|uniref:threonine-phosphate decarboxylase CobD n=1 Tax=Notoacmeibacter sp. MSK16QG-6 TaxID=2957982 RepID=UPI00209F4B57|nr:threonine-phosphate decarboxylase CobD [Notoacmeibacter sp. MSK16QG-6]MCP1199781.1 threonine-phosphate decarboxylase CobD [Notoacmeibacter sp. MSK16QG-6]
MPDSLTDLLAKNGAPPALHGGDLSEAENLFPDAPQPWVDLSTGISPFAYPLPPLSPDCWARLPQPAETARLCAAAALAYGAKPTEVVAGAGTQPLVANVLRLLRRSEIAIVGPTYAEHGRICRQIGHSVRDIAQVGDVPDSSRCVIVVNPDNPTGTLTSRSDLLDLARHLQRRGGLLIVDEAFMDSAADSQSLCDRVIGLPIVVLRSFGKFYGLAGLRLGFAIAGEAIAGRLRSDLGPWPVSGPAIGIGQAALRDTAWQEAQRQRLVAASERLDQALIAYGFKAEGVSPLFRTLRCDGVPDLFDRLGRAGIWTRRFAFDPDLLRIGLPSDEAAWRRLCDALRHG